MGCGSSNDITTEVKIIKNEPVFTGVFENPEVEMKLDQFIQKEESI